MTKTLSLLFGYTKEEKNAVQNILLSNIGTLNFRNTRICLMPLKIPNSMVEEKLVLSFLYMYFELLIYP